MTTSPSPRRQELHEITDDAARNLVDETLGTATEWRSLIVQYRLTSEFQAHWKAETGHWIHTARVHGYERPLIERARARANDPKRRLAAEITTTDRLYGVLLEELHPAMLAHYLLRTGWRFRAWDTPDGVGGDVDLAVDSPEAEAVDIQIKAPGEDDPIAAIRKAPRQLARSPHRCLVAVCSRSQLSVACEPNDFLSALIGPTEGLHANVVRLRSRGLFGEAGWSHIGGVVLLDYIAGLDNDFNEREVYTCTALLNPWCSAAKKIAPSSLPRARSLILDGERFRWEPSDPDRAFNVPTGTYVPQALR